MKQSALSLFQQDGRRKYLDQKERAAFDQSILKADKDTYLFCKFLRHTGARVSEALAITSNNFDLQEEEGRFYALIPTLKKRQSKPVLRRVPLTPSFFKELDLVYQLARSNPKKARPLWGFSRTTAFRKVKAQLNSVPSVSLCPRALRHTFGIQAAEAGIPPQVLQAWMGHEDINTTVIYSQSLGADEYAYALKMW